MTAHPHPPRAGAGGVLHLFAGPGGWEEGQRLAGYAGESVGVDTDLPACRTATAAGHLRVQADVAELDPARFARDSLGWAAVDGLIASPPCQAWSTAGKRAGERDRERCRALVEAYANGPHTHRGIRWADPRSPLVAEPVRWARVLRPRWVALEQVPPVLPLWEHVAVVLRRWGYRAWTGILAAEAYGVPQTRRRAVLMASLDGPVGKPAPTHQEYRAGREVDTEGDLFGPPLPAPVSMATALGWDGIDRPARTVCGNRGPWVVDVGQDSAMGGGRTQRYTRPINEPSPTLVQAQRWQVRPATTVQGDARIWPPGHKVNADDLDRLGDQAREWYGDRAGTDAVRVSVVEAGILQGFRPDYPWRGTKTAQYSQVGNAVPPPLAAAILRPLLAHLAERSSAA